MTELRLRCLVAPDQPIQASVVAFDVGLSFWGGFDVSNGCIIDRSHPGHGQCLSGKILCLPAGRGSSSSSSVLTEAIRLGSAPAAIVLSHDDPLIVTGALVAQMLYDKCCPVVTLIEPMTSLLTLTAAHARLQLMAERSDEALLSIGS